MLNPKHHIVNLVLNQNPVSVTYCDLVDCVRVLTDETKVAIPLRVGGFDIDNQMVFLFGDHRYGQSSDGVPLRDHAFDRTTLGKWTELHPSTVVYLGPKPDGFDT